MRSNLIHEEYSSDKQYKFQVYQEEKYYEVFLQKRITDEYMGPDWFTYSDVRDYIKENGYTIISIEGPVQDTIHYLNDHLLPNYVIMFITGLVGVAVAIAGVFVEPLTKFTRKFKKNRQEKRKRRYRR